MIAAGWCCGALYDQALPSQAVDYRFELLCRSRRLNLRPGFNVDLTRLHHDLRGHSSSTEHSRENHGMDGRDKPGRDATY
jgi:hypothetical protein